MAKVLEYDITGVEASTGGTGVKVPIGVRIARIVIAEWRDAKKDGTPTNDIRIAFNFGSAYDWGFSYINPETADWKLAELIRGVGMKDKGKLDLDKHVKGKFVRVKVNPDTYDGQPTVAMGRIMAALPGDDKLWEEGQGLGAQVSELSTNGSAPDGPDADDDAPAAAAADDDGFQPFREGQPSPTDGETVGSYDEWEDGDLEAECSDRGLTIPGGRGGKKDKMIKALRADDEEAAASPTAHGLAEDMTADAGGDDYDSWDLDRLKQEWGERNFGDLPNIRGRGAAERMKAAMIEEIRKDDAENPFQP